MLRAFPVVVQGVVVYVVKQLLEDVGQRLSCGYGGPSAAPLIFVIFVLFALVFLFFFFFLAFLSWYHPNLKKKDGL